MNKTRIILADDHSIVREGLKTLLEARPEFQVIGETGDGLETVRMVEQLKPNVLIVDLMMPGLNGLEVTRQIHKRFPLVSIIVLSMHADEAYVDEALQNGATGYVLKDSRGADLIKAITEVLAGRRYLSPPLSERAVAAYSEKAGEGTLDQHESLTTREREVLQLVAEGNTNAEIASRLFISPRTVEVHRANLMHKLSLKNQSELIRYALRRGILKT